MFAEGITITIAGMTSVFLFLLLLVSLMYGIAAIFKYLEIQDGPPIQVGQEDDALIAAAVAVKLKNS